MSMELDHLELWSAVFNTFSYSAGSRVDYPRLRTHCLMLICVSVMGTNCRNSLTKSLLVFCQKPGCITHWGLFQSLLGLESRFDSPPNLLSGFISPYLCSYLWLPAGNPSSWSQPPATLAWTYAQLAVVLASTYTEDFGDQQCFSFCVPSRLLLLGSGRIPWSIGLLSQLVFLVIKKHLKHNIHLSKNSKQHCAFLAFAIGFFLWLPVVLGKLLNCQKPKFPHR